MMDHVNNIWAIFLRIKEGIELEVPDHVNLKPWEVFIPAMDSIDPDKFNRALVKVGEVSYAISVFQPYAAPVEAAPLELTQEAEDDPPRYTCPPTFIRDFRQENPGLHKLYVRYALEELTVIKDFMETMYDFSRISSSILASHLMKEVQKEIMTDAAWFEAAALIHAHVDLSPYLHDKEEANDQEG